VEITGWNLPSGKSTMDGRRVEPGVYPISVRSGNLVASRVPFALDTLSEAFEREPNSSQKDAQRVNLPVIVNGRVQEPGDWDVFSLQGRAGDRIVAEVYARRLMSPLDSVLELTDAGGRRLAFSDDHEDKGFGLITHQADSLLTATLPANGTYYLRLGDIQRKGGREYAYRLRISPPRPDFDLRVAPSSVSAAGCASVPLTVYAARKDGFEGDIALDLNGAPGGFTLSGGLVPAGQDQVRLTLTVPPTAPKEPVSLRIEGRAKIQGKTVVRQAVPAEDMMQAFAYRHLVPADDLHVSVVARGSTRIPSSILTSQPVKIAAGGAVRVRVALPPAYLTFDEIRFELSEPPDGIALRDLSLDRAGLQAGGRFGAPFGAQPRPGAQFVLQADAAKIKPGLRGNLIVAISGERAPAGNQPTAPVRRRLPVGTLPAIPFEIITPR